MRILYCTPLVGKSGADIYYKLLRQTQVQLNERVKFLRFHPYWTFYPFALRPFIKAKLSYDVIHSNAEFGFVFKSELHPLIVSVLHIITNPFQTNYLTLAQKLYYQLMLKYMYRSVKKAQIVITISKATEQTVRNLFGVTNVETVYCGIDTNIFKPISIKSDLYPEKIKLLFVGNLTKRKGVDLLPKIMEKLDNRFLLFYTTGLRSPKMVFPDARLIPLGRLTTEELVYWYNLCDIGLLPSRLEGFGYAVAEAMACGKPVVATNCSSLPEIVINGENGFLCKMDDVSDFVDKIMTLADNQTMRQEIGVRNRQRIVNNFNLEKMGKEYNELYRRVLKEFNEERGVIK